MGLESIVTWTLTPTRTGTHLRMEQAGFRRDQEQAYQGAKFGWQKLLRQPGAGLGPDGVNSALVLRRRAAPSRMPRYRSVWQSQPNGG